ncbi:cytosolic protein [Cytobacillus horneckiae]|uniref:cytosolic protein n=1 Tax=Cytobacillus horneckiae TaxID=549687 RepID=UPI003D9A13BB
MDDKEKRYSDFSNVESQRNDLAVQDLPEGPYGSPIRKDTPVENKSTPWQEGQHQSSAFVYENKELHKDIPREMPGSHLPHSEEEDYAKE